MRNFFWIGSAGGGRAFAQLRSFDQPPLSQIAQEVPLSCKKVRWPKGGRTKIQLQSCPDISVGDVLVYHGQEFLVQRVHASAVSVSPPLSPKEWPPRIVLRKTLLDPAEVDAEIRTVWGVGFIGMLLPLWMIGMRRYLSLIVLCKRLSPCHTLSSMSSGGLIY